MNMKKLEDWTHLCVSPEESILDVARVLQEGNSRLVLVVGSESELLGVVTDGDIRRGLLQGLAVGASCSEVLNSSPIAVEPATPLEEVVRVGGREGFAIPIVDNGNHLVGVWSPIFRPELKKNLIVIMAGGKGKRLLPLTTSIPKPLLPLAGRPMLHRLLENIRGEHFNNVVISVNHFAEQIMKSVKDGSEWDLSVSYVHEDSPLGTAGALGLLDSKVSSPLIVINSDVVTDVRLGDILEAHEKSGASITVGMRVHDIEHPFGVLDLRGSRVMSIREKPIWREFVSAGVYALSPSVLKMVSSGSYIDMPDLIALCLKTGQTVEGFPLHESWFDVGTPETLENASDALDSRDN